MDYKQEQQQKLLETAPGPFGEPITNHYIVYIFVEIIYITGE